MKTTCLKLETGKTMTLWLGALGCLLHTAPLNVWSQPNPVPQGSTLYSVAYGNGTFVAVGDSAMVFASTDGVNWAIGNTGTNTALSGITFGNGSFVAVGGASVFTSPDGARWMQRDPGPNDGLVAVAYGNGRFMAVGGGVLSRRNVAFSTNLTDWTVVGAATVRPLRAIAYGSNLFRIVGNEGEGTFTSDGLSWGSGGFPTFADLLGVAYGNGGFLIVGRNGFIAYGRVGPGPTPPPDAQRSGTTNDLYGVAFGNGRFVAVGEAGTLLTSTNAVDWSAARSGLATRLRAVTFGNGLFVAVGDGGRIVTSPDGITWTVRGPTPEALPDCHSLARYFPMHEGDTKRFRAAEGDVFLATTVNLFHGRPVVGLIVSAGTDASTEYFSYAGDEVLVWGESDQGDQDIVFDSPAVWLDEDLVLNGGTRTSRTTAVYSGFTANLTLTVAVTKLGSVTVPAGTFGNCRQLLLTLHAAIPRVGSASSRQSFVLAPGVGIVRLTDVNRPNDWADLISGTVNGSEIAALASLSQLASPSITTPPANATLLYGSTATLRAAADGSDPLGYQWLKDGTNVIDGGRISGANSATLTIAGVRLDDQGSYSIAVTNSVGCVTSQRATMQVVPDVTPPTVTITNRLANARVSQAMLTLGGKATDNAQVDQVVYQLNGGAPEPALGTTNWTALVTLLPGTNLFQVYAVDPAGNRSGTNRLTVVFVATSALNLSVDGSGTVGPLTNGQSLELGQRYTVKATPRSGSLFRNWSGDLSSTSPTLTFTMVSNLTLTANFIPDPFGALAGNYTGLFYDPQPPAHDNAGMFNLRVTGQGAFSGKLQQGTAKYPFSGQFDLALNAQSVVPRPGTNELAVTLQLRTGSGQISGIVSNDARASQLFGDRAVFNASTNPATNFQGSYTMLLPGADEPPEAAIGHGFARVIVSSAGSVSFRGTLGDGSAAVQTVPLSANGQWPCYVSLYAGRGSILGWLSLVSTSTNDIAGRLLWTKPKGVAGALYPAGFINELETLGSRYVAPPAGTRVLNLTNAFVRLQGGHLTTPLTNQVMLDARNKLAMIPPNTPKLALTFSLPTGTFNGSFVDPQSGKLSALKGVLLRKQGIGAGFFLGTNRNGQILITETAGSTIPGTP